tara:strand:+ start:3254 stop:3541 length:288 start_codon:yes stop_codon:yes gene_type:complete
MSSTFKKIKIQADKSKNQTFKTFEAEVRLLNLTERAELNDKIMDQTGKQNFSFWLQIIKDCTRYTDEELNVYSLDELVAFSSAIIEDVNKKKLKK